MVRMGAKMKKNLLVLFVAVFVNGCTVRSKRDLPLDIGKDAKASPAPISEPAKPTKTTSVVVEPQDLAVLDKMNKAVEAYVLKNEQNSFKTLCKDKRFDCYVDEKKYPAKAKKIVRKVPPYASGSKMGLQGETRVHVRYDFYP